MYGVFERLGAWGYFGVGENAASFFGLHPTHNGMFNARFGGGFGASLGINRGPSLHVVMELEPHVAIPKLGASAGGFHVDSATGFVHGRCATPGGC